MANFRILSFCGGGMRGLMSAAILQRLDAAFFAKNGVHLTEQADMIAGTSTDRSSRVCSCSTRPRA
jgi:patatin-like phospholipase/acyl hydrolase